MPAFDDHDSCMKCRRLAGTCRAAQGADCVICHTWPDSVWRKLERSTKDAVAKRAKRASKSASRGSEETRGRLASLSSQGQTREISPVRVGGGGGWNVLTHRKALTRLPLRPTPPKAKLRLGLSTKRPSQGKSRLQVLLQAWRPHWTPPQMRRSRQQGHRWRPAP
jgi:hypothetical protein